MKGAILFLLLISLAACSPIYADPYAQVAAGEAAIQATQAARSALALQATIEAGRLQDQATGTMAAFEFTQRQTEMSATAQAAQALETARSEAATSTTYASQLATQTAYPPAATTTAAHLNAIARSEREAEIRARWEAILIPIRALFWPVFWGVVLVLVIVGVVLSYKRLMPVLELRLRTIPRGEHGAPLVFFPDLAVDLNRLFGPALTLGKGEVQSTGHAPTPDIQARITSQAQAVELVRALPHTQAGQRQALKLAARMHSENPQVMLNPPLPEIQIEIVDPAEVGNWLSEVEHKLLTERSGME